MHRVARAVALLLQRLRNDTAPREVLRRPRPSVTYTDKAVWPEHYTYKPPPPAPPPRRPDTERELKY